MINFVFVYVKNGDYRCLNADESKVDGKQLVKDGWRHAATLNPEAWIEFILNSNETKRFEAIECLS